MSSETFVPEGFRFQGTNYFRDAGLLFTYRARISPNESMEFNGEARAVYFLNQAYMLESFRVTF
jgi:hypothetical protein